VVQVVNADRCVPCPLLLQLLQRILDRVCTTAHKTPYLLQLFKIILNLLKFEKTIGLIKSKVEQSSSIKRKPPKSSTYQHCYQMPSKSTKTESLSFPRKLHALLEEAEEKGFQDLICWQSGGKSFKVLNPGHFAKTILPKYFKQTKFKSFQRQLNIYGFQRIQYGPNKGGCAHACLIQGSPELCLLLIRQGAPERKAFFAKKSVRRPGFGSVPSLTTRGIRNVSFLLRTARSSLFSGVLGLHDALFADRFFFDLDLNIADIFVCFFCTG
jgi:hypothetical protein